MTIQGRRTIRVTGRRGRYLCSGKLFEITNDDFVHFHRFTLTLKYLILFYSPRIWRALESQQIAIRKLERETSAFQRKLRGIRLTVPETPGIMAPESTIFPQKTSLLDWLRSGEYTEVGAKEIQQLFEQLPCTRLGDFQPRLCLLYSSSLDFHSVLSNKLVQGNSISVLMSPHENKAK